MTNSDIARALSAMRRNKRGGRTWRSAAKMSDADLIAGIKINYADLADSVIEY